MSWEPLLRFKASVQVEASLDIFVPDEAVAAQATITFYFQEETQMGEITVADDETTLHSTLTMQDAEGQPVDPGTVAPVYSSSDETVATVTPGPDGLSATYEVGSPGDAVITVSGLGTDADGNEIVGKGTIHVTAGNVAVASLDFATG